MKGGTWKGKITIYAEFDRVKNAIPGFRAGHIPGIELYVLSFGKDGLKYSNRDIQIPRLLVKESPANNLFV